MIAVLDASGNPEVFFVSALPIEGFEDACPYNSYWSEVSVESNLSGDYIVGPDGQNLYFRTCEEFIAISGDEYSDYKC